MRERKSRLLERNRDTIREKQTFIVRNRQRVTEKERERERRIYSKYWGGGGEGRTLIVPGSVMFSSMSIVHGITSSREAVFIPPHSPLRLFFLTLLSLFSPSFLAVFVIILLCDFNLLTKPQTSSLPQCFFRIILNLNQI